MGLPLPRTPSPEKLVIAWLFTGLDYFLVSSVLTISPLVLVDHIRQAVDKVTVAQCAVTGET